MKLISLYFGEIIITSDIVSIEELKNITKKLFISINSLRAILDIEAGQRYTEFDYSEQIEKIKMKESECFHWFDICNVKLINNFLIQKYKNIKEENTVLEVMDDGIFFVFRITLLIIHSKGLSYYEALHYQCDYC